MVRVGKTTSYTDRLISLLRWSALWCNFSEARSLYFYYPLYCLFCQSAMCIASAASLYWSGLKRGTEQGTALHFPSLLIVYFQSVIAVVQNDKLKELVKVVNLCCSNYTEFWQFEMLDRCGKLAWSIVKFYAIMLLSFLLFYFILPATLDTVVYILGYQTVRSFAPPLPITTYLDKTPPITLKNCLLEIFILFWYIAYGALNLGFMCSFFVIIMYSVAILRIFNQCYQHFDFSPRQVESTLRRIIIMQQHIIKLGNGLKNVYGLPFFFQNMMISICNCMCLFTLSTTDDKTIIIVYIVGFVYYLFIALISTYLGQLIETESEKMLDTLSKTPWHTLKPHLRKDMNLMFLQASKKITISYKGRSPISLRTFMQILNTSYSYYMVLRSML